MQVFPTYTKHLIFSVFLYFQDYIEPGSGLITIVAGAIFGTTLLLAILFVGLWLFMRRKYGSPGGVGNKYGTPGGSSSSAAVARGQTFTPVTNIAAGKIF